MRSNRSSSRLNLSSHANVRSTRRRNAWIAALHSRLRPRLVPLRLRGFSLMLGIRSALKMGAVPLSRERLFNVPLAHQPGRKDAPWLSPTDFVVGEASVQTIG